jgi:pSer/pThr/pTyr-binding forkhead associated (FHA) protein
MNDFKIITIGRAEDNDYKLSHNSVSRYHLKIFVDAEKNVFVTDLDSTNGTYVNGNRITGTILLQREDILKAGFDKPIRWMRLIEGELPSRLSQESEISILKQLKRNKINWLNVTLITIIVLFSLTILFFILNEFILK